ncbi:MAG: glycerophosphodiester phosphodiesterase, partial [Acetatifactor sp.]|nr:glycerophosphodiester phosphodiesterase [Acetatifactor sp.]
VFASFNYEYLQHLKELNPKVSILYNISVYDATLPQQFEAEYYGLNIRNITQEVVDAIHSCGRTAYVWTVDRPEDIAAMRDLGVDGIVTNCAGIARVVVEPPYSFLAEQYTGSFVLPGLYGQVLPEECADAVVQGMAYADGYILISAYRKSGSNSLLYVLDSAGKWLTTVDLGFSAHTGGIAYDHVHNLLWVTSASGSVCALDWAQVSDCFGAGGKGSVVSGPEVLFSFDAELVNHNGSKVASFLDVANGKLYVGSYVIGSEGMLRGYDLTDPAEPKLVTEQRLPEKIQGMTTIAGTKGDYLLLSQSAQTDDSALLVFCYDERAEAYTEVIQSYVLPEGAEQMEAIGDKLMILFESAARPYQETARIRNDQVYVVDLKRWLWE